MAVDIREEQFEQEVVEGSHEALVVVDFWAPWCGPCRQLAPQLEAAVAERGDAVRLVKVNTDESPYLAQRFGIRGIPAVKAFRDGRVVDEFTGALPRRQIEDWLDAILPSEADLAAEAGDVDALRTALASDPRHLGARLALGRALLAAGEPTEAVEVLREASHDAVAAGLLARAELAADPSADPEAAAALAALEYDAEGALEGLLAAVRAAGGERRDRLRAVMVGVFAERGQDDPLVLTYRRRLASALY